MNVLSAASKRFNTMHRAGFIGRRLPGRALELKHSVTNPGLPAIARFAASPDDIACVGRVAYSFRAFSAAERCHDRKSWLTGTADGVGGPLVATPGRIRASHGHCARHRSRSRRVTLSFRNRRHPACDWLPHIRRMVSYLLSNKTMQRRSLLVILPYCVQMPNI